MRLSDGSTRDAKTYEAHQSGFIRCVFDDDIELITEFPKRFLAANNKGIVKDTIVGSKGGKKKRKCSPMKDPINPIASPTRAPGPPFRTKRHSDHKSGFHYFGKSPVVYGDPFFGHVLDNAGYEFLGTAFGA